MYYILFIVGIVWLLINLMKRPKTRIFWQTRIAPLLERGVQRIQQEKDRIASDPKAKRRAILIVTALVLIVLTLIFR